jgi:hypothetical protein
MLGPNDNITPPTATSTPIPTPTPRSTLPPVSVVAAVQAAQSSWNQSSTALRNQQMQYTQAQQQSAVAHRQLIYTQTRSFGGSGGIAFDDISSLPLNIVLPPNNTFFLFSFQ